MGLSSTRETTEDLSQRPWKLIGVIALGVLCTAVFGDPAELAVFARDLLCPVRVQLARQNNHVFSAPSPDAQP